MTFRVSTFLFVAGLSLSVSAEPTPLPKGPVHQIAFGSCAKHWQSQPIWEAVLKHDPDLWLFLGDSVYADTDGLTAWLVSKESLAGDWNRLADKPEFQAARAALPMLATWDNHDYGSHAEGAEFEVKHGSKEAFLDFWDPNNEARRSRDGIYESYVFGPEGRRLQIILLDTKFNRSAFKKDPAPKEERLAAGKVGGYVPDSSPKKTHLGAAQWAWLEEALKKPADLRLLCSSIQVIPDQKGMDEWGNFPHERERLLALLKSAGHTLILSGNVHFCEVSETTDGAVTEFTSSGMTHINESYAGAENRFRVAGPLVDMNAGLVDVDWSKTSHPVVTLKALTVDGKVAFSHQVSF